MIAFLKLLWQNKALVLIAILLTIVTVMFFSHRSEISAKNVVIANLEKDVVNRDSTIKQRNQTIATYKVVESDNLNTIANLKKDNVGTYTLMQKLSVVHTEEVKKYKAIIQALKTSIPVTGGSVILKDCKIKIGKVENNETDDYIGYHINRIGY